MEITGIGPRQDSDMITATVNNATRSKTQQKLKAARNITPEKIDAVSQEFEAQFISQMLSNMFSTVEDSGVMSGGEAEQTYKSFLTDEYGKIIARAGGIGVSDQVKREMLKMQEARSQ